MCIRDSDKSSHKIIEPTNQSKNDSIEYTDSKLDNIEEEQYEDFDPSYFDSVQIK